MILLLHPKAVKPKNRRFPLAILSIAAVLEGVEDYEIVDGNLDPQPGSTMDRIADGQHVELLAVSVMPGPQMVSAIALCRAFWRLPGKNGSVARLFAFMTQRRFVFVGRVVLGSVRCTPEGVKRVCRSRGPNTFR